MALEILDRLANSEDPSIRYIFMREVLGIGEDGPGSESYPAGNCELSQCCPDAGAAQFRRNLSVACLLQMARRVLDASPAG